MNLHERLHNEHKEKLNSLKETNPLVHETLDKAFSQPFWTSITLGDAYYISMYLGVQEKDIWNMFDKKHLTF
jgi:hypothetical protein